MKRNPKVLLWDAQQAAEAIATMLSGKTSEQFSVDVVLHSAVERKFEIIGEALAQLARADASLQRKSLNFRKSSRSATF